MSLERQAAFTWAMISLGLATVGFLAGWFAPCGEMDQSDNVEGTCTDYEEIVVGVSFSMMVLFLVAAVVLGIVGLATRPSDAPKDF